MSFLYVLMKDRARITSVREKGNESEDSDNTECVGTKETAGQNRKQETGENDNEDVATRQIPLPQQEHRIRKRSRSQENINIGASGTLI